MIKKILIKLLNKKSVLFLKPLVYRLFLQKGLAIFPPVHENILSWGSKETQRFSNLIFQAAPSPLASPPCQTLLNPVLLAR